MTLMLLQDAYRSLKGRLIALLLLMIISGVFEGLGLSMLFPVLARFGIGNSAGGPLQDAVSAVLATLRLPDDLGVLLAVTVAILCTQVAVQTAKAWAEADCQTRYTESWQCKLFGAFVDADWKFFTGRAAAARVNAIVTEVARVNSAFYLLAQILTAAVFIIVYAAISLVASWQIVVFLVVFGGVFYWILRPLGLRARVIGDRVGAVNEALQRRTSEFMESGKLLKVTATEEAARAVFSAAADQFRHTYRAAVFSPRLVYGIYMLAGYSMLALGLWVAVTKLSLDPATVLVSLYVFLRLYVQMTNLQQFRQSYLLALPALEHAQQELFAAREAAERLHDGVRLPADPAEIRLEQVSVHYGPTPALDQVSLVIPRCAVIGVTGASGAGKSTLVDLIAGLVKPDRGAVLVDGIDLGQVALRDWRTSIGYVGQETILFNDTIAANIAWGSAVDRGAVEAAARLAHAHEFIAALPDGYDTPVGDRGVRLSGGQRQRLGLARALAARRRLLILDEATSALDSESEAQIIDSIKELRGTMTVVMVAHRLSTLGIADRIVVLDAGRIVEAGAWNELLNAEGRFSRLWQFQQKAPSSQEPGAVSAETGR